MSAAPRVLVTGGSGRTGTPLVDALVARGYRVRAISSRPPAARAGVEWIAMDFRDSLDFSGHLDGCDVVLHLGAAITDPTAMMRVNAEATAALAAAAEWAGVRFFCYTSSVAVYGAPACRLVSEATATVTAEREVAHEYLAGEAARLYARTKLLGERAIEAAAQSVEYVVLRPTMEMRDRDLAEGLAVSLGKRLIAGRRHAHHLHVDDFVHAILWLMELALARPAPVPGVTIYNLSDDDAASNTLAGFLRKAHRVTGDRRFATPPAAPALVDRLAAMAKYRNPAFRLPFGAVRYSPAKLAATGYRHAIGIEAAQDRLLRGLVRAGEGGNLLAPLAGDGSVGSV